MIQLCLPCFHSLWLFHLLRLLVVVVVLELHKRIHGALVGLLLLLFLWPLPTFHRVMPCPTQLVSPRQLGPLDPPPIEPDGSLLHLADGAADMAYNNTDTPAFDARQQRAGRHDISDARAATADNGRARRRGPVADREAAPVGARGGCAKVVGQRGAEVLQDRVWGQVWRRRCCCCDGCCSSSSVRSVGGGCRRRGASKGEREQQPAVLCVGRGQNVCAQRRRESGEKSRRSP